MKDLSYVTQAYCSPAKFEDTQTIKKNNQDVRLGDIIIQVDSTTEIPDTFSHPPLVLLGIPQDEGVRRNRGRVGAADAPDEIRKALFRLTPWFGKDSIDTENFPCYDIGNLNTDGLSLEEIHTRQEKVVHTLIQEGMIPIVLGGGHDIAYPNACGLGLHNKELGIINFDRHADVRPLLENGAPHSGSPFRQILEDKRFTVPEGAFIEFGLQPFSVSGSHIQYLKEKSMQVYWLEAIEATGFENSLHQAYSSATEARRPLYVTFDMDSVCAVYAPGVSSPATLGFTGEDLCRAGYFFGKSAHTAIMDIAEVNPSYDIDNRTARLAAHIIAYFWRGVSERTQSLHPNLFD